MRALKLQGPSSKLQKGSKPQAPKRLDPPRAEGLVLVFDPHCPTTPRLHGNLPQILADWRKRLAFERVMEDDLPTLLATVEQMLRDLK